MNEELLTKIRKIVKKRTLRIGSPYVWDHTLRVYDLCEEIGRYEYANLNILRIASLLHDVAKPLKIEEHAKLSAETAEKILEKLGLAGDEIAQVKLAIQSHNGSSQPTTLEAKILSDADKIDKLGAIGVASIFVKGGLLKRGIHKIAELFWEEEEKSFKEERPFLKHKLTDLNKLHTERGKRLARKRLVFMRYFFDQLKEETSDF